MNEMTLARMDAGETNRRILSKDEYRADFRRVEAASLKRMTNLKSGEGKRLFARCFYSFQASLYLISALGRTKLPLEYVEQIEQAVRAKLEEATAELNKAIDGAELLLKNHNIESIATYDTVGMEIQVGVTSALGRRYFELIHKLDQLMPMMQTLEIEEVISEKQVNAQRSKVKRLVLAMSTTARNLWFGVRRRMNEEDSKPKPVNEARAAVEAEGPVAEAVTTETFRSAVGPTEAGIADKGSEDGIGLTREEPALHEEGGSKSDSPRRKTEAMSAPDALPENQASVSA
jgi:Transcriptional regulator AcaB